MRKLYANHVIASCHVILPVKIPNFFVILFNIFCYPVKVLSEIAYYIKIEL